MLSAQDNDTLTRVGPDTAMGGMIRRFWIPALLAEELAHTDGKPVRLRLLGEDLVAFRDSKGRVGLLEERCPHRQASLALGANEECGLRCIYHGWKFDVDGQCVDAPTEPENSRIVANVRAVAYPTREAGGVIWTYMGPAEDQPAFPEFEWLKMARGHCAAFKVLEDCNYAQAVEGTIDSAHAGVLHRHVPYSVPSDWAHERDLRPKLEVDVTRYGLRYGAVRSLDDGQSHARVTQVVLPFYTMVPPDGFGVRKHRRMANAFVPRDDYSTWHVQWFFDTDQVVDIAYRIEEGGHWVDENYRKKLNIDNWYGQDREEMKTGQMSGIKGILTQDHAVSESQGRILDRTKEHLGTSDIAVVAWRRMMIKSAKDLAASGMLPAGLDADLPFADIKAVTTSFPADKSWRDAVPLDERVAPAKIAPRAVATA